MARTIVAEIAATGMEMDRAGGEPALLAGGVIEAAEAAERATGWMLEAERDDRNAGAAPYLRLMALALGAHYHGRAALAARDTPEAAERLALARFFIAQVAPQTAALARAATAGAAPLYAIRAESLGA
jgi:hypothetical protein